MNGSRNSAICWLNSAALINSTTVIGSSRLLTSSHWSPLLRCSSSAGPSTVRAMASVEWAASCDTETRSFARRSAASAWERALLDALAFHQENAAPAIETTVSTICSASSDASLINDSSSVGPDGGSSGNAPIVEDPADGTRVSIPRPGAVGDRGDRG